MSARSGHNSTSAVSETAATALAAQIGGQEVMVFIHGTFREHSGNIQGTFSKKWGKMSRGNNSAGQEEIFFCLSSLY
jgi:hypothetical protein